MKTVSHLFMPDSDFEYGGQQIWDVLDYRPSRFRSLTGEIRVLVKFLNGDEIWAWAGDLVIRTETECDFEFGPEHEHDERECSHILANMSADYDDGYDPYGYGSGWYDYDAGLRWSDFVEGPIGD